MKKYRFFYHFYRQYRCMSVHFRGQCMKVKDVVCNTPCQTKWSKRQPNLIMTGYASSIQIVDNTAYIT